MRIFRLLFGALLLMFAVALVTPAHHSSSGVAQWAVIASEAQAQESAQAPSVDVKVTEHRVIWYANPTVLAIGGAGILLLVLLVAMSNRSGGTTTIIKE